MQALMDELKIAEVAADKIRSELLDELIPYFDIDMPTIGVHECDDSPVGLCVYDDEEDPCHDTCLVCDEPHERK